MTAFLGISLLLWTIGLVSTWRIFAKAGRPGWASVVPIYNSVLLFQIAGQPAWQGVTVFLCAVASRLLQLFPEPSPARIAIGLVFSIVALGLSFVVGYSLAEKFGKGRAFGTGMALLPFVFYPILAFGDAQYDDDDAGTAVLGLSQ